MITEQKILSHVGLNINANSIEVRWENIIKRDEEVISRVPHRKAYTADQKAEFEAEVEGAASYVQAIGW